MPIIKPPKDFGDNEQTKGVFKSKWPGVCNVCGLSYEKGEYIHYADGKIAHEFCHGSSEFKEEREVSGHGYYREVEYTVKGKRNHEKPCGDCGLTHAGECF